MNNHEFFKETFDQLELSAEFVEEMKNMEKAKSKRNIIKYATAVAAAFALVVLSSNGICYAMTGNGIVEEVVKQYKKLTQGEVRVDNDNLSDEVVDAYVGEDGMYHYEFADGTSAGILVEEPEHTAVFSFKQKYDGGTSYSITAFVAKLEVQDGRIVLNIVEPIDITDDFADGVAEGTFVERWKVGDSEYEATFGYRLEGSLDNYTFDAWWIEE